MLPIACSFSIGTTQWASCNNSYYEQNSFLNRSYKWFKRKCHIHNFYSIYNLLSGINRCYKFSRLNVGVLHNQPAIIQTYFFTTGPHLLLTSNCPFYYATQLYVMHPCNFKLHFLFLLISELWVTTPGAATLVSRQHWFNFFCHFIQPEIKLLWNNIWNRKLIYSSSSLPCLL